MLVGLQAMWTGLCGAVSAGYAAVSTWTGIVVTTAGTGVAEVGKKILGL